MSDNEIYEYEGEDLSDYIKSSLILQLKEKILDYNLLYTGIISDIIHNFKIPPEKVMKVLNSITLSDLISTDTESYNIEMKIISGLVNRYLLSHSNPIYSRCRFSIELRTDTDHYGNYYTSKIVIFKSKDEVFRELGSKFVYDHYDLVKDFMDNSNEVYKKLEIIKDLIE